VSQVFLDVWRFAHRFEYRSRVSHGCSRSLGSRQSTRSVARRIRIWMS
jgi:hypothetical protein